MWKLYRGFVLHIPLSGGKAGKGRNVTGSVQVREGGRIVKQFRFRSAEAKSRRSAMQKARLWCDTKRIGDRLKSQMPCL